MLWIHDQWIRNQLVFVYIPDKIYFGVRWLHTLSVSVEWIFSLNRRDGL